jgi:hypothetical protein
MATFSYELQFDCKRAEKTATTYKFVGHSAGYATGKIPHPFSTPNKLDATSTAAFESCAVRHGFQLAPDFPRAMITRAVHRRAIECYHPPSAPHFDNQTQPQILSRLKWVYICLTTAIGDVTLFTPASCGR